MEDFGLREEVIGQLRHSLPREAILLAAAPQRLEPEALYMMAKGAECRDALINGLIDRLKRANTEFGITLFIIEHNMRAIMNMASTIYCLAHGELLAAGDPAAIQRDQRVIDAYLGAH